MRIWQAGQTDFEEEKVEVSTNASVCKKMKVGVLDFEAVECSPIKKIKGEKKVTSKVFGNWDIYGTNYSHAFQCLFSVLNELW